MEYNLAKHPAPIASTGTLWTTNQTPNLLLYDLFQHYMTVSWPVTMDQNLSPPLRKALGKNLYPSPKGVYFFSKESKSHRMTLGGKT